MSAIDDYVFHLEVTNDTIKVVKCSKSVMTKCPHLNEKNLMDCFVCDSSRKSIQSFLDIKNNTENTIYFESVFLSTLCEHKLTWCDKILGVAALVSRDIRDRNEANQKSLQYNLLVKEKECNQQALAFITHQIKNKFLAISESMHDVSQSAQCCSCSMEMLNCKLKSVEKLVDDGLTICMTEETAVEIYNDEYVNLI